MSKPLFIGEYQNAIIEWCNYNWDDGPNPATIAVIGLAEEVGELCRAILKQYQNIRGTHEEWQEEIRKELGDVFIKTCHVASRARLDLQECIEERWAVISQRDFIKNPIGHGLPED